VTDDLLCTFEESWRHDTVIVSCVGDIDMTTSPELERRIAVALDKTPVAMIVDLSRLEFLASSGMTVLVAAHERCSPTVRFAVVAHGPMTKRPMELVGVTDVVTVHPTLEVALKAGSTQPASGTD
jgi:anti-sigma B factor antagonist